MAGEWSTLILLGNVCLSVCVLNISYSTMLPHNAHTHTHRETCLVIYYWKMVIQLHSEFSTLLFPMNLLHKDIYVLLLFFLYWCVGWASHWLLIATLFGYFACFLILFLPSLHEYPISLSGVFSYTCAKTLMPSVY